MSDSFGNHAVVMHVDCECSRDWPHDGPCAPSERWARGEMPYCLRDPSNRHAGAIPESLCEQDVHGWFQLSYCSYLVLQRTLMQEMPAEWQHAMVNLLDEMHRAFPESPSTYTVLLRDEDGKFVSDPLRNYRYPSQEYIDKARGEA
jgi:hypothetical protein